ncbi:hypothetical protein [Paenibacillus lactis]|uniref:hypothetical protein n=1 Tax=Paenibacillus lactis TaxID=228574 RepID=UPI003D73113F
MNNQLLIDELRELAEVMRDYAEESRSVGSQRLESYYVGKAVAFEEVISMIESSPVPAIGCSECDYKGYFEYETGVVDEGTGIKEIAKEPCDCVIGSIPTIKPGDKVRHAKYGHGDVKKISAWVWFSDGPEYKAINPDDLEVVE